MRRLCLLSFYDREGKVDRYFYELVSAFIATVENLIVVSNSCLKEEDKKKLKGIGVLDIRIRDNLGFDAGAYKSVLTDLFATEEICNYDELIFCNDTCYGPFIPMTDIFSEMDEKDVDFWGLQQWNEGYCRFLCSNFLVFRKSIINNPDFYNYFENHIDENSTCIADAYGSFEMGLFKFLDDKGYRWDCYAKPSRYHSMKTPDYMISDCKFPFMKRRAFCPEHYHEDNLCAALNLIEKSGYDPKMVLENAGRRFQISDRIMSGDFTVEHEPGRYSVDFSDVTPAEIINFIKENADKDIYVYGAGAFGSRVCVVYREYAEHFKGFAVTKSDGKRRVEENVTGISEIDVNSSAFIVGLDKKNTADVMSTSLKNAPYVLTLYK